MLIDEEEVQKGRRLTGTELEVRHDSVRTELD